MVAARSTVAFFTLPEVVALRCEPFDLKFGPASERGRFVHILRQTPAQILAPYEEALTELLSMNSQGHDPAKQQPRRSRNAEALSAYGQVLQAAYKQSGTEEILRAVLTVHQAAMRFAPGLPVMVLRAADALFDLCRTVMDSAQRSLTFFLQAEDLLGRHMCNAKVVLLHKELGQWAEAERYAKACGLSAAFLHLQHPKLPTKSWWNLQDAQLPRWLRNLALRPTVRAIRSDLKECLAREPAAFNDAANDWFFVGSRSRWTGLNLMHSFRGGWSEQWCGAGSCAKQTCDMLRSRRELNYSLWSKLSSRAGIASEPPPMYVNFYALEPGTHIIPHLGNDGRLTIHLALEVPHRSQSRIRVGNHTKHYTHAGQVLIFDDAYEHEVWNDGRTTRYVLGITIWHPVLLSHLGRHEANPEVPDFHYALSWRSTSAGQTARQSRRTGVQKLSACRGRLVCQKLDQAEHPKSCC